MIQQQTLLKVSDNSGAKIAKCIKVLGGFKRRFGYVGDILIVSIQQLRNKSKLTSKVQKGEVYRAIIIRTKTKIKRKNNIYTSFNENSIILLNKQNNPIATRILGPISKKLKREKYQKLISISSGLI